jgi:4-amino-4-deoxy-L-arabinose transferase-like glycosyltransferase
VFSLRSKLGLLIPAILPLLAYFPFLFLPLISDDYIQLQLGRQYGPLHEWGELAADALYRCRATSILITYWTDQLFGADRISLNLTSLLLHILNVFLVYLTGIWRRVGFRISFFAACFFAVYQRPQEAVVWYAALPELLVFFFVLIGLLCWIRYVERGTAIWYAAAFVSYLLALLSKESAVIFPPLALGIAFIEHGRRWRTLVSVAPFAFIAGVYFLAAHSNSTTHLHFNDGTFSLSAPFYLTELRSIGRMLWVWGLAAVLCLIFSRRHEHWKWIAGAFAWMIISLLPYSFLTYQGAVPSRHTYLAAVGIAMLVGRALAFLWFEAKLSRPVLAVIVTACLVHQIAYLWFYKRPQYVERALPTERLLESVASHKGPVVLECFPYSEDVARTALEISTSGRAWLVVDKKDNHGVLRVNGCL